jgi:CHASE2 domain-containing sensor protein
MAAVLAGAAVYLVGLLGWSVSLNGSWQDGLQHWLPRSEASSPVVLVTGGEASEPGSVGDAVSALRAAGARQVGVLVQNPAGFVAPEPAAAMTAWPVQPEARAGGRWRVPSSVADVAVVHGLAASKAPAYRHQPLAIETPSEPKPTIEAAMAGLPARAGELYRIDYRGGLATLPQLSLADAAAGDLLAGLIDDRHVLIAPGAAWDRPRYDAPVRGPGVTDAQLHAFALRSLLEGRPLAALPAWAGAILAVLVAAVAAASVTRFETRLLGVAIVTGTVFIAGACVSTAWALGWLLPGVELALALVLPAGVLFYRRERAEDALLARLASAASVRARQRDLGVADGATDRWPLLVRLVADSLGASRLVVLRCRSAGGRLEGLAGAGADAASVATRHGDARRAPFDRAGAGNNPIPLSRPVFGEAAAGDLEYLVPLAYGGEILGYVVLAIAGDDADAVNDMLRPMPIFAERLAELLYLEADNAATGPGHGVGKRLSAELAQSLTASERRLALFDAVLAQQETAIAVYDVLGQAVYVNHAMSTIGEQAGIQPQAITATDLLAELAGLEPVRARGLHRQAVAQGTPVSLPLERPIASRRYMLSVSPLAPVHASADSLFARDRDRPANDGFFISLTDYTSAANLFQLAESLRRFVNTRLRNDLINIQFASDLLVDPRLPEERRERAAGLLRKAIARADDELDVIDQELSRQAVEGGGVYPLDAVMVLRQALPAVEPLAVERGVTLALDLPSFSTPALARPHELDEALRAALALVIDGASPGAELAVAYREDATMVTIEARAAGYGMPDERLQHMLTRAERDEPSAAAGLRQARDRVRAWGGELTAQAELGEGVQVILALRRVVRSSEAPSATTGSGGG